jgi:hypothetical protein
MAVLATLLLANRNLWHESRIVETAAAEAALQAEAEAALQARATVAVKMKDS